MKDLKKSDLVETLKQMALGEEVAYRLFYTHHYNDFIKFGRLITSHTQIVEDAIQNILIWFIQNPKKIKKLDRPDLYLFQSLRNNLIREVKKSQQSHAPPIDQDEIHLSDQLADSPERHILMTEESQNKYRQLQSEIEQLPDYLKQSLYLRFFSNLSYQEISEIMQIQPNVARIYIHRAVERLRKTLKSRNNH